MRPRRAPSSGREERVTTSYFCLGTLNVETPAGRIGDILDMIADKHIDILCLQETRISAGMVPRLRAACQKRKCYCCVGECQTGRDRRPYGTNVIIARWPIHGVRSFKGANADRAQFVAIHDSQGGPIILANVHGPPPERPPLQVLPRRPLASCFLWPETRHCR